MATLNNIRAVKNPRHAADARPTECRKNIRNLCASDYNNMLLPDAPNHQGCFGMVKQVSEYLRPSKMPSRLHFYQDNRKVAAYLYRLSGGIDDDISFPKAGWRFKTNSRPVPMRSQEGNQLFNKEIRRQIMVCRIDRIEH
jgi:hypothetical protein